MQNKKNITGYKTPESYFETFEEQLFSNISAEKFSKKTGFNVPNNYFENLEERVLKTVIDSAYAPWREKPKKVIPLYSKKYLGYAAAIAACLIIGFSIFNNKTDKSNLDALQLAAIDTYIEEGNLNLDIYDLTSYIDDEDISDLKLENKQFSETALKNYLLENVDTETLINER
ncbi:MAG: hypothetical protein JJE55_08910 [Flavobacteriaceae bacterium]|nr:hypothetical protein [Flavobacteriaceae bacterium]